MTKETPFLLSFICYAYDLYGYVVLLETLWGGVCDAGWNDGDAQVQGTWLHPGAFLVSLSHTHILSHTLSRM